MPQFSRRLVDNPQKWEEYARSFDGPMVATAIAGTAALTALAQATTWLVRGQPAVDGRFGLLFPWLLALAVALTALIARRQMRRQRARRIPLGCWAFGTLQMLWLIGLGWYVLPEFSVVLAVALWAVAYHDARYFYDAVWLRLHYLLVWPLFFLILLGIDLLGGPGLLARMHTQPGFVRFAIGFVVMVAALIQIILAVVGRQWYRLDAKVWAHAETQTQLAAMRREREVIARSCAFIAQGLTAGQFSHDVASPLSTVSLSVGEVAENLDALAGELAVRQDPELLARVTGLREAAQGIVRGNARLHEMTTAMMRSLRGGSTLGETDVETLMRAAVNEMASASARHGIRPATPMLAMAAAKVLVTDEHPAAIGSILCNGALQNPEEPLLVEGRAVNPYFYAIAIRDHGVEAAARTSALARVRAALALVETGASADSPAGYQGYGVGLTLAKLLLVRHNGWLAVDAPAEGAGLVFRILLPRIAPAGIPVGDNAPEKLV